MWKHEMFISKGQTNVNMFYSKKNTNNISDLRCLLELSLGMVGRNSVSKATGPARATRNRQFMWLVLWFPRPGRA